jgi:hypothetical protein
MSAFHPFADISRWAHEQAYLLTHSFLRMPCAHRSASRPWWLSRASATSASAGLARKATPQPGFLHHKHVVGAVADRKHVRPFEPKLVARFTKGFELGLAVDDRILDLPAQLASVEQ